MDQFKFSLGPFELFASIIGGIPLCLAGYFFYRPVSSLQELVRFIQENSSITNALLVLSVSYILSSTFRGLTWRYFKWLSQRLNHNYRYFGDFISKKQRQLQSANPSVDEMATEWMTAEGVSVEEKAMVAKPLDAAKPIDFEYRLVFLLQENIGIPPKIHWIDTRIEAYLREHNKQATLNSAELYLATHIMYRTWSFGFGLLSFALLLNPFRAAHHSFGLWILPLLSLAFAYLNYSMALSFKRWHNRELLLGFYFAAMNLR